MIGFPAVTCCSTASQWSKTSASKPQNGTYFDWNTVNLCV